ncbi:WXG100 family type VII secretion target [Micromonospora sp. HUAS LYJ1]|uniref:WXG100 family type VII secretion target n=1 Tax=Micromonospora sp. HUAS LYJ1 TaxID=3061626 RepID=UPI0026738E65|nr:WXG100 family type VII secretion target [Micromonospora sp. HUAS LYJ1]WKU05343.1 WXG100 family type VII secretion target [Micromonospora sp. HUAS LYJ1]
MGSYRFNFIVADQTLDHMNSVNKNLQSALAELEQNCRAHLREWDGAAQQAYALAEAQWRAGLSTMTASLDAGRKALFDISEGYGSADQRAAQIWSN